MWTASAKLGKVLAMLTRSPSDFRPSGLARRGLQEAASVGIPLLGAKLTQKGMAHDPIVSSAMEALAFRPQ
jgi:hypothetical protein